MALAVHVFYLQYVPGVEHPFCAVPDPDLQLAGEGDDILDPGSVVPIAETPVGKPAVRHISACL